MKKISIFALLSILGAPAFAESDSVVDVATADSTAPITADVNIDSETVSTPDVIATDTDSAPVESDAFAESVETVADTISDNKGSFLKGLQVGVGVSATGGLNGFIGYANKDFDSFWAKRFGVRFDFATTRPVKTLIQDGIDSLLGDDGVELGDGLEINNINLSAKHFAAMLDFYPFGNTWFLGGWRLTGGYYMGDMHISAGVAGEIDELSSGAYEFELNDTHFRYLGNAVRGSAKVDWDYRGPYVGTGFDFGLFAGFKIYLDAGVVFTNRAAQLGLNVPFTGLEIYQNGAWESVEDENLESVVDGIVSETLSDAQSDLDDLTFYPIVKVGFMYRF